MGEDAVEGEGRARTTLSLTRTVSLLTWIPTGVWALLLALLEFFARLTAQILAIAYRHYTVTSSLA